MRLQTKAIIELQNNKLSILLFSLQMWKQIISC